MRKLFYLMIVLFLPLCLLAQEEENSYMMWETMYISPDYTDIAGFSEAMTNHNKKYHGEGTFQANVYNVVSGPNVGKMLWIMGPCTYSDLDNRPSGAHDDDWANNVMPHIKKMHNGEYWRMNAELSNISPDDGPYALFRVRFHEVRRGMGYRINEMMGKISKVVKSMEGDNPWGVFINDFQQGYTIGRHIATVSYYNSWSELDEDNNFADAYRKVHGENSWIGFLNDMQDVFSNSWDEFWAHAPNMSGPDFDADGNE